jgi:glucose-6-phosphate isomerase
MMRVSENQKIDQPSLWHRKEALTQLPVWQNLEQQAKLLMGVKLQDLCALPHRFEACHLKLNDLVFDFSRQKINEESVILLSELAEKCSLAQARDELFAGEKINLSENRAVKHWLLRAPDKELPKEVLAERNKLFDVAERLRNSNMTDVVNIGIGGSDLGPVMVAEALKPYWDTNINVHFVSNIDPVALEDVLIKCRPESTVFIVSSKSFTTEETLENMIRAKNWLSAFMGKPVDSVEVVDRFYAVTANAEKAKAYHIHAEKILSLWDWVGGRYSVWSAIGLPLAILLGKEQFSQFLSGAYLVDTHFKTAPWHQNIPVMMALLGVWQNNFFDAQTQAVIAYSDRLKYFTNYLQQLDMESNGKSVDTQGRTVDYATGPVIWGGVGTNVQHAFFQSLHQSKVATQLDFIMPIQAEKASDQLVQNKLIANALGQLKAFVEGQSGDKHPADFMPGNKPSNVFFIKNLSPMNLGMLIACYEHKVFTQGVIWNLNSFDQPGVELGKKLARGVLEAVTNQTNDKSDKIDNLTREQIQFLKEWMA